MEQIKYINSDSKENEALLPTFGRWYAYPHFSLSLSLLPSIRTNVTYWFYADDSRSVVISMIYGYDKWLARFLWPFFLVIDRYLGCMTLYRLWIRTRIVARSIYVSKSPSRKEIMCVASKSPCSYFFSIRFDFLRIYLSTSLSLSRSLAVEECDIYSRPFIIIPSSTPFSLSLPPSLVSFGNFKIRIQTTSSLNWAFFPFDRGRLTGRLTARPSVRPPV